ncbi:hypothetical protein RRF57_001594 [Xylaria bambusicola]|uniref:Uncharacterized protein n=1 Tax=Xylaria bambusicola TaxID=326684 RepID=A0AAN7UR34_9PEZI
MHVLATPTKTNGMIWSGSDSLGPPTSVLIDSIYAGNQLEAPTIGSGPLFRVFVRLTRSSTATVVSSEQKRMMPIVSILVRPYYALE